MEYYQQQQASASSSAVAVAGPSAGVAFDANTTMSDEMHRRILMQQQQELQMQQQQLEQQLRQLQQKQMMEKLRQQQEQFRPSSLSAFVSNNNQRQLSAAGAIGTVGTDNSGGTTKNGNPSKQFDSLFGTLTNIVGSFENSTAVDAYDVFSNTTAATQPPPAAGGNYGVDNAYPMVAFGNNHHKNNYINNSTMDQAQQQSLQQLQHFVPHPQPNKRRRVKANAAAVGGGADDAVGITPSASPVGQMGGSGDSVGSNSAAGSGVDGVNRFRHYQADQWSTMLEELLAYKRKFGDCNVPHTSKEFPALGRWVKRQRYQYKIMMDGKEESTMTPARVQVLERAGFIFDSHGSSWAQRFQELQEFKKEYGHCNVPSPYQSNPALSNWTKFQRRQIKKNLLTQDRIDALNAIGFQWELRKKSKSGDNEMATSAKIRTVDV